ncbi:MAG: hypothetical protein FWH06_05440 [Oscillospiraceae bacterium]|nr:hypothetical protein [Oscillospiraceae bacterium]
MEVFRLELKKILRSPMLFVFLALCFGFNLLLVIPRTYYFDYADYVADASRTTGYRLGAEFDENLLDLEPGELRDWLREETYGAADVFDGYDTAYIADAYIERLNLSGYKAEMMRGKYAALQAAVNDKASTDESLTLYFASATSDKHFGLHGITLRFLIAQCGILAALIMLLSLGYEHSSRTAHTVYATKTGRHIQRHKMLASLSAGMMAFAVLMGLTLAAYFALNDYGNTWGSSVSSGFNYINDMLAGVRPFVTWQRYTVLTYLLAVLVIAALLTVCFGTIAFVIGTWMKNSYIGFLVFLIINAGCLVFAFAFAGRLPAYLSMLSPAWLWIKQPYWFTDGGADILWKNFEVLGVCASLVLLAGLCLFSAKMFRKRDIV